MEENRSDDASKSSKESKKGKACVNCNKSKKKCNYAKPTCARCARLGEKCSYTRRVDSNLLDLTDPSKKADLQRQLLEEIERQRLIAEQLQKQEYEIARYQEEERMYLIRAATLFKSSELVHLIDKYKPALQPTTGNQVPYLRISHFFYDTNPSRQAAMYAMLSNGALILENVKMARRFLMEATQLLLQIEGDPEPQNMALYVSAMIDIGTHHQAFFDFESAIRIYYRIRSLAEKHPHLFFAAWKEKKQGSSMVYQSNRFKELSTRQEEKHYPPIRNEYSNSGVNNNNNMPYTINEHHNDDDDMSSEISSDSIPDLPIEEDAKTTFAADSFALPSTPSESLLFHLGYAFEALMLMTQDQEYQQVISSIKGVNSKNIATHAEFNEIREALHRLNQTATIYLKKRHIMDWEYFKSEIDFISQRSQNIEVGRRIYLMGQEKVVRILGLMAAMKKSDALLALQELTGFAVHMFFYGKANVIGFGLLFSVCVCYDYLKEHELFNQTLEIIKQNRVEEIPVADRCLDEIRKFKDGREKELEPFFAKLAAILDSEENNGAIFFTNLELHRDANGVSHTSAMNNGHYTNTSHNNNTNQYYNNNNNNTGPVQTGPAQEAFYVQQYDQHADEPSPYPTDYSHSNNNNNNREYNQQMLFNSGVQTSTHIQAPEKQEPEEYLTNNNNNNDWDRDDYMEPFNLEQFAVNNRQHIPESIAAPHLLPPQHNLPEDNAVDNRKFYIASQPSPQFPTLSPINSQFGFDDSSDGLNLNMEGFASPPATSESLNQHDQAW